MKREPLKNELRALVSCAKARCCIIKGRKTHRQRLKKQIGGYLSSLVDGYATETHCRPDYTNPPLPDAIARNEVRVQPARRGKMVGRQKIYPAGKILRQYPEGVGGLISTDPLGLNKWSTVVYLLLLRESRGAV